MGDTIFLTRASLPSYEEYIEEIRPIWENHWITSFGPKHSELENSLKEYLQCAYVSLFSNGHSALEMTIQAMDLSGEVITTPYTFASTTNAIVRNGLTPVFCDIEPDFFTMDPGRIESLITEKTSAIIPVHVYGNVCAVGQIEAIAKKHHLKVLYDAAHAFGVCYGNRSIASYGDASVFSFHASKVFNTAEGGAVCYRDLAFGERLNCIRNFGIINGDCYCPAGNGKMSELSAALGLCNLRKIGEDIQKRRAVTELYLERFRDITELSFRKLQKGVKTNYAYFPVVAATEELRDYLYRELQSRGVMCQKHFGIITSSFTCYRNMFSADVPNAETISKKILLLPLYSELEEKQVLFICDLIHEILRGYTHGR